MSKPYLSCSEGLGRILDAVPCESLGRQQPEDVAVEGHVQPEGGDFRHEPRALDAFLRLSMVGKVAVVVGTSRSLRVQRRASHVPATQNSVGGGFKFRNLNITIVPSCRWLSHHFQAVLDWHAMTKRKSSALLVAPFCDHASTSQVRHRSRFIVESCHARQI